jgi:hypothetical protein
MDHLILRALAQRTRQAWDCSNIDAMLRCRSVRVEIRGSSVRMLVNRGCSQRRVLSPLLWNIVVTVYFVGFIMHIIRRRTKLRRELV